MWYVYVIKSKVSSFRYTGSTNDLERRLKEHNNGETQSTKAYLPFELEAYIAVNSESKARKLEKYLKTGSGRAILRKKNTDDRAILIAETSVKAMVR